MKKQVAIILAAAMFFAMIPVISIPTYAANEETVIVSVPWEKINNCGHQAFSGPCQAYCWAYCRIILDNQAHTYFDYWTGSQAKAPSAAGYASQSVYMKSKQTLLETICNNVDLGRPVVVGVNGTPGYAHFVVAIGYKAGCNRNHLSESDILILNPASSAINVTRGSSETYTYLSSCTLTYTGANYVCWTATSGGTNVTNTTSNGIATTPTPPATSKPLPPSATYESGKWSVTIPANYKLLLYSSEVEAVSATYVSARSASYRVLCTKKAILSNGIVRYYGAFNTNDYYWLTYSNGMTIEDADAIKTHIIHFNANGGNVSTTSKEVTPGGTFGDLPTPTQSGYTFDGWHTAASGGAQVTASTTVNLSSNQITLYAHWVAAESDLYIRSTEQGDWHITLPDEGVPLYETATSAVNCGRYGYKTIDCCQKAVLSDGSIRYCAKLGFSEGEKYRWIVFTPEIVVKNSESYTVVLDPNGGRVSPSAITVKKGSTYGALPQPIWNVPNSYDFIGWYTAPDGGTKVDAATSLSTNADHTLYAHWNNIWQATLDPNGGAVLNSLSPIKVEYKNSRYFPVASRPGYTFDGWYTEKDGGEKLRDGWMRIVGGAYFYAHWTPIATGSYTVTFDSLGADTPDPASIEVQAGGTYGKLPFVFGPTFGSVLVGWFTEPTGGQQVQSNDPLVINANHTLYAHYIKELYMITFDPNGGSVARQHTGEMSSYPQEYIAGAKAPGYGELPKATWSGHEFLGWYTAPVGGTQVVKGASYVVQDDHILYAHWK